MENVAKTFICIGLICLLSSCSSSSQKHTFDPQNFGQLKQEGLLLGQRGEHSRALEKLHEANNLNPNDSIVHAMLGAIYSDIGNEYAALLQAERAYELNPLNMEVLVALAKAYLRFGKYSEAKRAYGNLHELKPIDYEALLNLGFIAFKEKNFQICQEYFKRYIKLVEAMDSTMMTENEKNRYRQAYEYLQSCETSQQDLLSTMQNPELSIHPVLRSVTTSKWQKELGLK